jgi:hypothetical protein
MRSGEEGHGSAKSCGQNCGNTDISLVPRRYLRNDPKKTSIAANGVLDANARRLLDVPDQVLRHCGAQAFSAEPECPPSAGLGLRSELPALLAGKL